MILLDTCALLWLESDRKIFTKNALKLIEQYADALAVSPVSFMEVGQKMKKKKLSLPMSLDKWTDEICSKYSLTVIPLTRDIAVRASELPDIHLDPFDRIIIATAVVNSLTIVSSDRIFTQYSDAVKVVW